MKLCLVILIPALIGVITASLDFKPNSELDARWKQYQVFVLFCFYSNQLCVTKLYPF